MPYIRNGKTYRRVTEVVAALECEATAFISKHYAMDRPQKSNTFALGGSLAHYKIEGHVLSLMKNPPKQKPFELDPPSRLLMNKLLREHKRQKKIEQANKSGRYSSGDVSTLSRWDQLQEKVKIFYGNFNLFLMDYPFKPIMVEERLWWDAKLVAGTVDLIATFRLKGVIQQKTLHQEIGSRPYFVEDHHLPDAQWYDVLTITDWKTSATKLKSFPIQMSAYHLMWEALGKLDHFRRQGFIINQDCWSAMFGERKRIPQKEIDPKPYQLVKYMADSKPFLEGLAICEDPRPLTLGSDGSLGIKGRCLVCQDIAHCPDHIFTPMQRKEDLFIPLIPFTTQDVAILRMALKDMNTQRVQILKDKLNTMGNEIMEISEIQKDVDLDKILLESLEIETANH